MKLFLSKYYPIEKVNLPTKGLNPTKTDALSKTEVGGIVDFIPNDETNSPFLVNLRNLLSEKCDYTADCMPKWLDAIGDRYGAWNQFGRSLAYVTLVPAQASVAIFTQGELAVWLIRAGEEPTLFKTDGKQHLAPTQMGDIWLILKGESDKPTDKATRNLRDFAYQYAIKSFSEKNYNKNFYILNVEKQIDITEPRAVPTADERSGKGALCIAKQLLAAGQSFASVEPLLKILAAHESVGAESKQLLEKYKNGGNNENSGNGEKVENNRNSGNSGKEENNRNSGNTGKEENNGNGDNPKWRPSIIVGAAILGSVLAYKVKDISAPQPPRESEIVVPQKKDTNTTQTKPSLPPPAPKDPPLNKIPELTPPPSTRSSSASPSPTLPEEVPKLSPSSSSTTSPKRSSSASPSPTLPEVPKLSPSSSSTTSPKLPPAPQPNLAQTHLKNAMDLFNDAQSNIEQNPSNIHKALFELHLAEQSGLDAKTYLAKSTEITTFKNQALDKLKREAAQLISKAATAGKTEKDKFLGEALAKLELEQKIQPSDELTKRLNEMKERMKN
jgi:hypothetical protein